MIRADRFLIDTRSMLFIPVFGGMLDAVTLPDGAVSLTARVIREGDILSFRLTPRLAELPDSDFPPITRWNQLNLQSATATLTYHNGTVWVTMVANQEYDEVTTAELTLVTTTLLSAGTYRVMLAEDSITGNKIDKFSVDITLVQ